MLLEDILFRPLTLLLHLPDLSRPFQKLPVRVLACLSLARINQLVATQILPFVHVSHDLELSLETLFEGPLRLPILAG